MTYLILTITQLRQLTVRRSLLRALYRHQQVRLLPSNNVGALFHVADGKVEDSADPIQIADLWAQVRSVVSMPQSAPTRDLVMRKQASQSLQAFLHHHRLKVVRDVSQFRRSGLSKYFIYSLPSPNYGLWIDSSKESAVLNRLFTKHQVKDFGSHFMKLIDTATVLLQEGEFREVPEGLPQIPGTHSKS